jgi:serine/threonine protein kinase
VKNKWVGPFLILQRLGSNRRQRVFHARQVEQGRDVALKFVKLPDGVDWDSAVDKIDREVAQLQKLRHPHLVQVYGAGFEGEDIFFATELIDGESLATILTRRGKFAPDQVVEYGRQICEVLQFLHEHDLVHSNLTPEKTMVNADHQIKLTDFRLNRANRRRWDASLKRDLELAAYMAPEQFTEGATAKSDFYALGVMLYEMLSGKLPYRPDTISRMHKNKINAPVPSVATHVMNCPIWLDQIVTQMLDPDPRNRPHSAKAINITFEEIKKIDATKQAAVSQMTLGFNPLTVGQDKSEARKLLGKGKRKKKNRGESFYQAAWFQVLALLMMIAIGAAVTLPIVLPSEEYRLSRAQQLIESDSVVDWSEARSILEPIIRSESELADEAEQAYFESRRKTLVYRAEKGKSTRIDSDNEQKFAKAVALQLTGDNQDAVNFFAELIKLVDPEGDERHIYFESQDRYQQLSKELVWPTEPIDLLDKIMETKTAKSESELMRAQAMLGELTIKFASESKYKNVVEVAAERLQQIKLALVELRSNDN